MNGSTQKTPRAYVYRAGEREVPFISVLTLCAAFALVHATDATAADATNAPAEENGLTEIVVTARKTAENLETTPVAVSVFDAARLEQQQITDVFQITQVSPGLSAAVSGPGGYGSIVLAIRGNSQLSGGSFVDSPVGTYVDGVYIARPILGNLGLLDLDSVQVLRGTQGTLFGRNTTGGALVLTTVQPDGNFGGYVEAGFGDYSQPLFRSAATVPLYGDELSMRVAASFERHDNYGTNPVSGYPVDELKEDYQLRDTVRYAPHDSQLTVSLTADFEHSQDTGPLMGLHAYDPSPTSLFNLYPQVFTPGHPVSSYVQNPHNFFSFYGSPNLTYDPTYQNNQYYYSYLNHPETYNRAYGTAATVTYDWGPVAVKSITAYRDSDTNNSEDLDATPANLQAFFSQYLNHQFSQEFQITGKGAKFDWIAGTIYFHEGGQEITHYYALNNTIIGSIAPSGLNDATYVSKSEGVYTQFNYHLTDAWRLTAGFRYTWDQREIDRHLFDNWDSPLPEAGVVPPFLCTSGPNAGTAGSPATCSDPYHADFEYPSWLLSTDYQLSDGLFVYAKTGGTALSGGFNGRPTPPGKVPFDPEFVKDVELGLKGDFWNRTVRTNLAAFYLWRRGAQNIVNGLVNGGISQYTANEGNIQSYGVEFEGTWLPWRGMEITTSEAYLNSRYQAGSFHDLGANGVTVVNRSDELVTLAPKYTIYFGATQSFPLAGGTLSFHGDYSYLSSIAFSQTSPGLTTPALVAEVNSTSVAPGYGVFNARIDFKLPSGLDFYVWGKNLGDKQYYTYIFQGLTSLGFSTGYIGDPRTYGAAVRYRF